MIATENDICAALAAPIFDVEVPEVSAPTSPATASGVLIAGQLCRSNLPERAVGLSFYHYSSQVEVNACSEVRPAVGRPYRVAGMPVTLDWIRGRLWASLYPVEAADADQEQRTTQLHYDTRVEIYQQCAIDRYRWMSHEDFKLAECSLHDLRHPDKPKLPVRVWLGERTAIVEVAGYGRVLRLMNTGSALLVGIYSGDVVMSMRRFSEFLGPVSKRPAER